ncbi:peptidoglycan-binding protein [Maricaulis sp.]|uniref:peptidoglycan-binding protein n=1 Tax=Maricaulis sp. TaxID=1486257 RepID=UPI003A904076
MSSAGPWSVKGIDPRARARAKTAARHDGVTLGEWLNRVILDDSDPANPSWDDALEGFPGFGGGASPVEPGEDRLLRAMVNRLTERIEAAEHQSSQTLGSLDKAINQLVDKVGRTSERQAEQLEETREDLGRVRQGQDDLAGRIAQMESGQVTGNPEAGKAIETTIMKLARRLYEHENDVAARLHDTGQHVKDQGEAARKSAEALALKLERAEHRAADLADQAKRRDERSGEVLNGLHRATDSLRLRVEGAERQTNDAARTLDTTVARLEGRLKTLESRNSGDNVELERRFDRLSSEVAGMIAETRSQLASALSNVAAEPRVDRLENALTQALGRIDDAERRQGDGMHKLGHELTKLAGAIERRLTENERRTQDALRDTRAEQNIDRRLDDVRQEGKESLRRMGDEVTRMGKALADRISYAEAQSSTAVAAATDRMAEVIARLDEKKAASDEALADRLRQSEERTAQRIEDAMSGVKDRLATVRADTEEVLSPVQRAMSALADRLEAIEARKQEDDADSGAEAEAEAEAIVAEVGAPAPVAEPIDFDTPLAPPPQAETPRSHYAPDDADPFLTPEPPAQPAAAAQPLAAPVLRAPQPASAPAPQPAPQPRPVAAATAPQSAISQPVRPPAAPAPQAAPHPTLQAVPQPVPARPEPAPQAAPQQSGPRPGQRIGATADADFLASARERTRTQSSTVDYDQGSRPSKLGRTLLIALPVVALVMLGGAGAILVWEAIRGDAASQAANAVQERSFVASVEAGFATADPAAPGTAAPATAADPATTETTPNPAANPGDSAGTEPRATTSDTTATRQTAPANAVADASGNTIPLTMPTPQEPSRTAARSTTNSGANTLESAAADGNPVARYLLGMRSLDSGDTATAAILLRRAAEQGVPSAQYRYGKLLETGEGVGIDLEAARRWTERAANAGHRRAMHNLAVMHYYGTGTAVNFDEAARWFQEAALLGLRDSQFNLALLFESGQGVPLSVPDAFTWYSIAASESDPTASQRAAALEEMMEPAALVEARRITASFQPRPIDAQANGLYRDLPWEQGPVANTDDVYRAQGFLAALGYSPGPIDGMIGGQTYDAVMAFEADQGLPQTGRVDSGLLDRLERAAAG